MSGKAHTIVWSEVYKRLEIAQAALERGLTLPLEEKKKILKQRAKALAQEQKENQEKIEYIEVVEFLLAYEKYCIELPFVREIYPLKELTPIPCTPAFVLGLINIRGQIISIIDIKKLFNLPEKGLTDLNKVIIVYTDEIELGILADVVLGTRAIPLEEIQPSLPILTGINAEYLRGVTKERAIVLNVESILSDKNIIVQEEVTI